MSMTCHIVLKQHCPTAVILPSNAVNRFSNTCDVNWNILVDFNTWTVSDAHIVETEKLRKMKVLINYFNYFNPTIIILLLINKLNAQNLVL